MATNAEIFEKFVRSELNNRISLVNDVPENSILIRKPGSPAGSKEFVAVQLQNGQVLGREFDVIQGVASPAASVFLHEQFPTSATSWVISHNKGTVDVSSVMVYNMSNVQIFPDSFSVIDINTVQINFLQPTLGKAYLSF